MFLPEKTIMRAKGENIIYTAAACTMYMCNVESNRLLLAKLRPQT